MYRRPHTHTHTEVTCRKEYCNIEYNTHTHTHTHTHTQKLHVEKCIAILNTTHTHRSYMKQMCGEYSGSSIDKNQSKLFRIRFMNILKSRIF